MFKKKIMFNPTFKVTQNYDTFSVEISPHPAISTNRKTIELTRGEYERFCQWTNNKNLSIQDVFPEKSPSWRELLISGMDDNEYDNL